MTVARDASITAFDELSKLHPEFVSIIGNTYRKLKNGFFSKKIVDSIMQKYHSIDIYDAFTFHQIFKALESGKVLFCEIELGLEPSSDKAIEDNNSKLSTLWSPFSASFIPSTGRGYNDDGVFYWDDEIEFGTFVFNRGLYGSSYPAHHAPLEVGYTNPETTFMHIAQQVFLARWPYGHTSIYLFYKENRDLWISKIVKGTCPTNKHINTTTNLGFNPKLYEQKSLF